MKRYYFSFCLFALIGGCAMGGGVEHKKVAFVLPQGWVKAESNDKDVTLAVPSGWRQGANTMFGTGNMSDMLATNDPSAPKMTPEDSKALEDFSKTMNRVNKEDELKNLDKLAQKGIILHCVSTNQKVIGEELTRFYVKKKSQSSNWTWPIPTGPNRIVLVRSRRQKKLPYPSV